MPDRSLVARELADLLGVLAHPQRVLIIEALRDGEHDVNHLTELLAIRHSTVSQHLSLLRTHRLLKMRREGRHVYYRLANPALARWLLEGLEYLESELLYGENIHTAVETARQVWADPADLPPDP